MMSNEVEEYLSIDRQVKVIVSRINMVPFNQGFTFSFNAIEMLFFVSSRRNNRLSSRISEHTKILATN